MPCTDVSVLLGYEAGRHDGLEDAAASLELKPSEIRLACGEMTAQEMRTVQAVLAWRARVLREMANDR